MSASKPHSVWSKEDLFVAARAGIAPRDSGHSPAHPDNWEATNAIAALKELEQQMNDLEEQLEARQKLIDRFLEWDALTALPEPLPAPFGDLHYWLSEFRRVASIPASESHPSQCPCYACFQKRGIEASAPAMRSSDG